MESDNINSNCRTCRYGRKNLNVVMPGPECPEMKALDFFTMYPWEFRCDSWQEAVE